MPTMRAQAERFMAGQQKPSVELGGGYYFGRARTADPSQIQVVNWNLVEWEVESKTVQEGEKGKKEVRHGYEMTIQSLRAWVLDQTCESPVAIDLDATAWVTAHEHYVKTKEEVHG